MCDNLITETTSSAIFAPMTQSIPKSKCLLAFFSFLVFLACEQGKSSNSPIPKVDEVPANPSKIRQLRAETLVDHLLAGRFDKARTHFDDAMQKALPDAALAMAWTQYAGLLGKFVECQSPRKERQGTWEIVFVPCRFEKGMLTTKVVFNPKQEIGGLFFLKGDRRYKPAPYAQTNRFTCKEIQVGKAPWLLPGTLCLPKATGPHPGLVLVHGSGPNDRDESIGPNKPFRDLAEGLASRGVAVLRYDKRTKIHARKLNAATLTTKEESRDDALAAAALMAKQDQVNPKKIFILGHSLGGMLLPQILTEAPKGHVAGGIVLAGTTRPFGELLLQQHRYLFSADGTIDDKEQTHLDMLQTQIKRYQHPKLSEAKPDGPLPYNMSVAYALDLRGMDPVGTAAKLSQPLLILQGKRDYQVTMKDFSGWKQGLSKQKRITFKTYASLNHLFMPGKGKSLPAEYMIPGHVDPQVIEDIVVWMEAIKP